MRFRGLFLSLLPSRKWETSSLVLNLFFSCTHLHMYILFCLSSDSSNNDEKTTDRRGETLFSFRLSLKNQQINESFSLRARCGEVVRKASQEHWLIKSSWRGAAKINSLVTTAAPASPCRDEKNITMWDWCRLFQSYLLLNQHLCTNIFISEHVKSPQMAPAASSTNIQTPQWHCTDATLANFKHLELSLRRFSIASRFSFPLLVSLVRANYRWPSGGRRRSWCGTSHRYNHAFPWEVWRFHLSDPTEATGQRGEAESL